MFSSSVTEMSDFFATLQSAGVGKRQPTDPYFHSNTTQARLTKRYGIYDEDEEELCHEFIPVSCGIGGCVETFETILDFDSHYNAVHRYPCAVCKKQLPTAHFLDLHLQETHDSFFAAMVNKKPSYSCFVEECKLKFMNPEERRVHCIEEHKFPHEFRYDQITKTRNKTQASGQKVKNRDDQPMDVTSDDALDMIQSKTDKRLDVKNVKSGESVQPKLTTFSFGRARSKGFTKYSGKLFTNKEKSNPSGSSGALSSDALMEELRNNLPEV